MNPVKAIMADRLAVEIYQTRDEMGRAAALDAAERLGRIIAEKGRANAVFAAAPSQNEFLHYLAQCDVDWSRVNAFHMDEYIGLPADAPQRFGNFLMSAIFEKLPFGNVHLIDGLCDPSEACRRYAALLAQNPPDIVFLGIGENGHLAFNDPPVADFKDPQSVKVVELDQTCRIQQVNDGCFVSVEQVPHCAITLTMPALMGIPEAICIVPGPTKCDAVYHTATAPIGTACPATALRRHRSAKLYADAKSGGRLLS